MHALCEATTREAMAYTKFSTHKQNRPEWEDIKHSLYKTSCTQINHFVFTFNTSTETVKTFYLHQNLTQNLDSHAEHNVPILRQDSLVPCEFLYLLHIMLSLYSEMQ